MRKQWFNNDLLSLNSPAVLEFLLVFLTYYNIYLIPPCCILSSMGAYMYDRRKLNLLNPYRCKQCHMIKCWNAVFFFFFRKVVKIYSRLFLYLFLFFLWIYVYSCHKGSSLCQTNEIGSATCSMQEKNMKYMVQISSLHEYSVPWQRELVR